MTHRPSPQSRGPRAMLATLTAVVCCVFTMPVSAGKITAKVISAEPIVKAFALKRERTRDGVYSTPIDGQLVDGKYEFDVPDEGRFDLVFETASGRFEGWDTAVPRSDYEEEQPLSDESKKIILTKMASETVSGFPNEAWVLDLQGNIQYAAALLYGLRTETMTESAGPNDREWISRVDRWQWECPDDDTWTTNRHTPYYALHRKRIPKFTDKEIWITYARSLGGFVTTNEKRNIDAGILKLPKITAGVHAMNPDGTLIEPIRIKPWNDKESPREKLQKKNTEDIPSPQKKPALAGKTPEKPATQTRPAPSSSSPAEKVDVKSESR